MADILLPVMIEFEEWSALVRVTSNLEFPTSTSVKNWREWANNVLNLNNLSDLPIPDKLTYPKDEDWRKWASVFIGNTS